MAKSTRPTARRRRRPRRKHVINIKRLAITALCLVLGVELAIAALTSPRFYIRHIEVVGNEIVPESDILTRLAIGEDANLFRIKKGAMARRLMSNPIVADVRFYRQLPDTLSVRVVERQADLTLKTGDKLYEVDPDGLPFRVVEQPGKDVPILVCESPVKVTVGKAIRSADFTTVRDCLLLVREKKNFQVTRILIDQNGELCLNVRDGFQVILGRPEQLSLKLDKAASAVEEIPGFRERGQYVNVTCPEAPAVAFRDQR